MAEFKLNIGNPKTGKTHKKEISGDEAKEFLHKKIGDKVKGDKIGFAGYEFEITGGSDSSGFPMRSDVVGSARKRVLITKGIGTRHSGKGIRRRRTVAGNTIYGKTTQINLKVAKEGKAPLEGDASAAEGALEQPKEKASPVAEEKKEEKSEKPKKEKPKKESAPEKKKEEAAPSEEQSK